MSGTNAFLRSLVGAAVMAALAPLALLLVAPFVGGRVGLSMLLATATAVALARSAAQSRTRRSSRFARDAAFALGGLAFAHLLATPGLAGAALAFWGFGLVLSLRSLVSQPVAERGPDGSDAFDTAHARAMALLEEEP